MSSLLPNSLTIRSNQEQTSNSLTWKVVRAPGLWAWTFCFSSPYLSFLPSLGELLTVAIGLLLSSSVLSLPPTPGVTMGGTRGTASPASHRSNWRSTPHCHGRSASSSSVKSSRARRKAQSLNCRELSARASRKPTRLQVWHNGQGHPSNGCLTHLSAEPKLQEKGFTTPPSSLTAGLLTHLHITINTHILIYTCANMDVYMYPHMYRLL